VTTGRVEAKFAPPNPYRSMPKVNPFLIAAKLLAPAVEPVDVPVALLPPPLPCELDVGGIEVASSIAKGFCPTAVMSCPAAKVALSHMFVFVPVESRTAGASVSDAASFMGFSSEIVTLG